jgi:hypothetical protein
LALSRAVDGSDLRYIRPHWQADLLHCGVRRKIVEFPHSFEERQPRAMVNGQPVRTIVFLM